MISFLASIIGFEAGPIMGYADLATSVVGCFALIATQTPNKVDDRIVQILMDVLNFMGGNAGKAKNA